MRELQSYVLASSSLCCMFVSMWRHGLGHISIGSYVIAIVLGVLAAAGGFGAAKTLDL